MHQKKVVASLQVLRNRVYLRGIFQDGLVRLPAVMQSDF